MSMQNYQVKNQKIREAFFALKKSKPERFGRRLNLSWSNWGFGLEKLSDSAKRLAANGIEFIELHGNHYGADFGYKVDETKKVLDGYGIKVGGICGMFSAENDLSSNNPVQRQRAVDYLKREIDFTAKVGGSYILVVPAAVGRPSVYDDAEFERSVETLLIVADLFSQNGIKAAIEPIRSAETGLTHTFADAKRYIEAVNHEGVCHINGDVYHMLSEESHIAEAICDAGEMLVNLHMADTNRCALGCGSLDLDTIIMALYLIGYNSDGRYVTPEPLGPGGDPYPAMNNVPNGSALDELVSQTAKYFKEREACVLASEG